MLLVSNLTKSYGAQALFEGANFVVNKGERIGLVGRNGHGKSTLFRLILGEEEPDSGNISIPKDYKVGHLSQHLSFTEETVLKECCLVLPVYDGTWQETYKAEAMLEGLGFSKEDLERAPSEFSGGFQIRMNLAKLLLSEPNLLLLDEPTNYLDIVSVRWLERFLNEWENEVILITHDRTFMDTVCTHTLGIHRGEMRKIQGSTEKLYTMLAEEEELYEKTRQNEEKKRKDVERFIERFRAKASKAKAVQSRVKLLEKIEVKAELQHIDSLEFQFRSRPFQGKWVLHAQNLSFGYHADTPLFSDLTLSIGKRDRIAVIGPNGRGKTTLLNVLAGELTPTSGNISSSENTQMAYFGQTNINRLDPKKSVEQEIGSVDHQMHRTVVRSICGAMMFEGDLALKQVSVLSGGERSRVMLGKLLVTPSNFLLLDEPTNHLDMYSIDSLLDAIDEFPGALVIVTHSELILHRIATRLVVFDGGEVTLFEGSYQDFLDQIGWESENTEDTGPSGNPRSKREKRKARAAALQSLQPLKRNVQHLEERIMAGEARINELQDQLAVASTSSDSASISSLSKSLHESQKEVEHLFEELERESDALQRAEAELKE